MKKAFCFLMALIISAVSLVSCSKAKYSEQEIKDSLNDLITRSAVLNEIYFGNGFPFVNDEDELEHYYDSFDTDIDALNYEPVDTSAKFSSEEELKSETREVFSADYSDFLIKRAFTGVSDVISDEKGNQTTTSAVYARFITMNDIFTQRLGLDEEALELGREYDLDNMTVIRQKDNYVLVDIPSELNGDKTVVRIKMIMTENGWRLDSPTY